MSGDIGLNGMARALLCGQPLIMSPIAWPRAKVTYHNTIVGVLRNRTQRQTCSGVLLFLSCLGNQFS